MDYMENILEELYLHDICLEHYKIPDTPEYHEHQQLICELEEKLLVALDGYEKEIYNELRESRDIVFKLEMIQSFVTGYLLASQIMIDVAAQMNNPKLVKMRNIVKKALRKKEPQKCIVYR